VLQVRCSPAALHKGKRLKTDLTRIPPKALGPIARAIETGDAKYSEGDWIERDSRDDVRAALGHIFEFIGGRDIDEESGEHVLAHAAARLLFILERQARGLEVGSWRAVGALSKEIPWAAFHIIDCPRCNRVGKIARSVVPGAWSCPVCARLFDISEERKGILIIEERPR